MNAISIKNAAAAAGRNMSSSEKFVYDMVHGVGYGHVGCIGRWFRVTEPHQLLEPERIIKASEAIQYLGNTIDEIESSFLSGPGGTFARPTVKSAINMMNDHVGELFRAGYVLDCLASKKVLDQPDVLTQQFIQDLLPQLDAMREKYRRCRRISPDARTDLRRIQKKLLAYYTMQTWALPERERAVLDEELSRAGAKFEEADAKGKKLN